MDVVLWGGLLLVVFAVSELIERASVSYDSESSESITDFWSAIQLLAVYVCGVGFLIWNILGMREHISKYMASPSAPATSVGLRMVSRVFLLSLLAGLIVYVFLSLPPMSNVALQNLTLIIAAFFALFLFAQEREKIIVPFKPDEGDETLDKEAPPVFQWDDSNRLPSLVSLYQVTVQEIERQKRWYDKAARKQKVRAQFIRPASIFFVGVGGIVPVLIDLFEGQVTLWGTDIILHSSYATLIIAIGSGLIVWDNHMSYSKDWMRFRTAETQIKVRLAMFKYEWESKRIGWKSEKPTPEETRAMVSLCASVHQEILDIVEKETKMWVLEFQSSLRALNEDYKTPGELKSPGEPQPPAAENN
jgi:hypothetical protein